MDAALLESLRDVLLVQCDVPEARAAFELIDRPGTGVVVTTRDRRAVRAYADVAKGRPFLVDAARYAGKRRVPAAEPFDRSWLAVQREAGLPVLTDSGYVAMGDGHGLATVLDAAAGLGDVVAVLPLHTWWLAPDGGLHHLVERVRAAGVPIAVVLEHRGDPLGVQRTLRGLLALLGAGVPVIQLRCDVSALGLLCHGALAAAVGTRSGLRHLYPIGSSGFGGAPAVSTLVRDCLAYVDIQRIAVAVQSDPESSLWRECPCPGCKGEPLDRLARLSSRDEQGRAAFVHALVTLFDLRAGLLQDPDPVVRQASWRGHCDHALTRYLEMEDVALGWNRPDALRYWFEVEVPTRAVSP
ncbi:hypothetical protein [Pseudonocardia sp. GCM10023141]|uniref:hypothetical protein n=1 Tax=Pseudonocardia sp. GCM10023141 TaxID=3252653 RepID=UPI003609EF3B